MFRVLTVKSISPNGYGRTIVRLQGDSPRDPCVEVSVDDAELQTELRGIMEGRPMTIMIVRPTA